MLRSAIIALGASDSVSMAPAVAAAGGELRLKKDIWLLVRRADPVNGSYSTRSASMGSVRMARRAGM
jgi:hypothetical protein